MIDIHTHLQFPDFDADRDEVIARARDAGVGRMIVVGTDVETSRAAIALAEKHDFLYASVGVHPHEFNQSTVNSQQKTVPFRASLRVEESAKSETDSSTPLGMTDWKNELKELARHPKVVAIGECGLDYFVRAHQGTTNNEQRTGNGEQRTISDARKKTQREGFLAQVEIAREVGLPLIIHTRPSSGTMDAYEDMYSILQSEVADLKSAILHCYQGDTEVTRKFLGLPNVFFSFAGNVTYPVKKSLVGTKDDMLETVKLVPFDRLFVETDCPYLAPQDHRGTRNEPAHVNVTAAKIAGEKGNVVSEIEESVRRRFFSVFHTE